MNEGVVDQRILELWGKQIVSYEERKTLHELRADQAEIVLNTVEKAAKQRKYVNYKRAMRRKKNKNGE